MPTVPRIQGRQVQPNAIQPVFRSTQAATREAFGGGAAAPFQGVGEALERVGTLAGNQALVIQRENNEREAKQLDIDFANGILRVGYGDPNNPQDNGYYSSRGEDALNGVLGARNQITELRQQLQERATNQRVLQMFNTQADVRMLREQEALDRHVSNQNAALQQAVSEARISTAVSDAAARYNDPSAIADALAIVQGETAAQADRLGLPEEAAQAQLRQNRTAVVAGAVTAALGREQLGIARQLLDQYKSVMDGSVHQELMSKLQENSNRVVAQSFADRMFSKYPGNPTAAMREIRASLSGRAEDMAITQIASRYTEARATREFSNAASYDQAYQLMIVGDTSFNDLPQDVKLSLTAPQVTSLINAQNSLTGDAIPTVTTPGGWQAYNAVMSLTDDEAARRFGTDAMIGLRSIMGTSEFNQVRDKIMRGLDPEQDAVATLSQSFDSFADEIGLLGDENTATRGAVRATFFQLVEQAKDQGPVDQAKLRELFNQAVVNTNAVPEPTGLDDATVARLTTARINELGLDSNDQEERGRITTMLEEELAIFRQINGRNPTTFDVQHILDRITGTRNPPGPFNQIDPLFDQKVDPNDITEFRNTFQQLGMPVPTRLEIAILMRAGVSLEDLSIEQITDDAGRVTSTSPWMVRRMDDFERDNGHRPNSKQELYQYIIERAEQGLL